MFSFDRPIDTRTNLYTAVLWVSMALILCANFLSGVWHDSRYFETNPPESGVVPGAWLLAMFLTIMLVPIWLIVSGVVAGLGYLGSRRRRQNSSAFVGSSGPHLAGAASMPPPAASNVQTGGRLAIALTFFLGLLLGSAVIQALLLSGFYR